LIESYKPESVLPEFNRPAWAVESQRFKSGLNRDIVESCVVEKLKKVRSLLKLQPFQPPEGGM
jgi:hypothetical protein